MVQYPTNCSSSPASALIAFSHSHFLPDRRSYGHKPTILTGLLDNLTYNF